MNQQGDKLLLPLTLHLPQYTNGDTQLLISGSIQQLGKWNNSRAVPLVMAAPGLWQITVMIDETLEDIEWNYMEIRQSGPNSEVVWQKGPKEKINSYTVSRLLYYNKYQQRELKVMSFNLRYQNKHDGANLWKHRRQAAIAVIKAQDADFVGLQEVLKEQADDIMSELAYQYTYLGRGRDAHPDKGEACPILYNKFLWIPIHDQTFWLSDTPLVHSNCFTSSLPRIANVAVFHNIYKMDYRIMIINTHFDLDQDCRDKSVKVLINMVNQIDEKYGVQEIIMMGDLNAIRNDQAIQRLYDNFKFQQFPYPNTTTFHDFLGPQYPDVYIIDHIFYVGKQFELKSYEINTERPACLKDPKVYPSDHHPIICTLKTH